MKTRRGRLMVGAAVCVFGVLFGALSLQFSWPARRFPLFASVLTVVMASLQLVADFRRPTADGGTSQRATSERSAIAWCAGLIIAVYLLGLSVTLPLFTTLYWRFKDHARWLSASLAGLAVLAFVQGVLAGLLRVDLYDGVIGQWLRR